MKNTGGFSSRAGTAPGGTTTIGSGGGRRALVPPGPPGPGGVNRAHPRAALPESFAARGMGAETNAVSLRCGSWSAGGGGGWMGGGTPRPGRGWSALPAPEHARAGGARRGGADARGTALPALRGGGPSVLRRVAGEPRADAARRGGPPGPALARGEVSLPDAVGRVDRASDRRRGRRAAPPRVPPGGRAGRGAGPGVCAGTA